MFEVMMQNYYFLCLSSQHIIFPDIKRKEKKKEGLFISNSYQGTQPGLSLHWHSSLSKTDCGGKLRHQKPACMETDHEPHLFSFTKWTSSENPVW